MTLGAIVAPPDAVSATAVGRRLGLPRRIMTLLGGESLLNDATALTAYKVALAAAIGTAASWGSGLATFALAAVGGVAVGVALGAVIAYVRSRLDDPLVESALGLVAPFIIYLAAEEVHGSGVLAVVVAALILGQRSTHAGYATRLQDNAVWKAVQLVLESFAFLMIGLQLPTVVGELAGISASVIAIVVGGGAGDGHRGADRVGVRVRLPAADAVVAHPRRGNRRRRPRRCSSSRGQACAAWCRWPRRSRVPMTTLSGAPFPGRPQLVFLTFVVVIGTLLLHGLTLPWLIRRLGVQGDEARTDAIAAAAAQDKAATRGGRPARRAAGRADDVTDVHERAAEVLRGWNTRRRNSAWERSGPHRGGDRREPDGGVPATAAGDAGGRTRDVHRRARQRAASTTRCCGRCCTGSTWRRRH